ncbi:Phosphate regulon sensor protein phoR [Granulibacter bethesdensis]|uniref:ATP-binding protein n=1 Tax=Granulibacter bethesdensis TaxID=364410 RepID=UPI00090C2F4C|nr:ATP-binding protein [Granulibacter bethesdensis]APH58204.1 Phosphate regulon sensor protein phoR [Granulibacter bethesdensis]
MPLTFPPSPPAVKPPGMTLFWLTAIRLSLPFLLLLGGLAAFQLLTWRECAITASIIIALALSAAGSRVIELRGLYTALRAGDGVKPEVMNDGPVAWGAPHWLRAETRRVTGSFALQVAAADDRALLNETIVEKLPDPLIILDERRLPARRNEAARTTFGHDLPAVLRHPGIQAAVTKAYETRTRQNARIVLAAPMQREVEATILHLEPDPQKAGNALLVLSDRSREAAVERMRADFVANASHELRTPLASLIGFIDTLRGPAAEDLPAQTRFLGIMAEQAERMNRLIDDLLSLSRIELMEHQRPDRPVMLHELIERQIEAFEPRLQERNMRLQLNLPPLSTVAGDADQLTQVLQNLLDNAIKYGRDGGEVTITAIETGFETGTLAAQPDQDVSLNSYGLKRRGVLVKVGDDGPGIPRMHLPRLTERFYRVDKARSRAASGTGLGLAIVKHIVNRHRGQLFIESEQGKGSTFAFWIPVWEKSPPDILSRDNDPDVGDSGNGLASSALQAHLPHQDSAVSL